jgi:hypothetical protein
MKYLVMIYGNQTTWETIEAQFDRVMRVHRELQAELTASGELLETNELSISDAAVVRTAGGVPVVTDGPFAEAKELLAGYYLLECASLERATEIAGRLVEAEFSPVEVRRVGTDRP